MADDKFLFYEKDKLRGLVPTSDMGRADQVYGAYLHGLGIETDPEAQIELARSQDPRFRRFLDMIGKPNRGGLKIQTMAKQCGIDLSEFQNWYSKAAVQIAIAKAHRRAAGIVDDMAGDAMTRSEFCERCDGLGWVNAAQGLPVETPGYRILCMQTVKGAEEPVWCRTCPKCKGETRIRVPGDEHARDRVLEIAGLVSRGKAGVQIVQNFGGAGHTSAVSGSLGMLTVDVPAEEVTESADGVEL